MAKRKEISREERGEEQASKQERRTKRRHEEGSTSQPEVNPNLSRLFKDSSRMKLFNEKFFKREVLEYKYVDFRTLTRLFETQHVDVADYIARHNWSEFVQVHRPINRTLIRVLISNLDESTMQSWIGKVRVNLSMESWCDAFELEMISNEEEAAVMNLSKEEIFFRLTGISNLRLEPFIRIKQLHQEANVRLAAQVVMSVLIPKKGSREQLKVEEGRLLYAMIYGKRINLVNMIIERLKSAMGRKTIPICYGMHLMQMMEKAGVDMTCAGVDETEFHSVIDHHTLRRLGYKYQHGGWDYVGKGQAQAQVAEDEEGEEEEGEPIGREEAQPSQPHAPSSSRPRPSTTQTTSSTTNPATKDDLTYLQQFLFEQFRLFQATILSKLDKMDSRLQTLEEHLILQPQPSPPHYSPIPDPIDPKGKRPIPPSPLSVHSSPKSSHPSHKSNSSSSSSSPLATTTRFKLASRKTNTTSPSHPTSHSSDSEATHSDPHPHSPQADTTAIKSPSLPSNILSPSHLSSPIHHPPPPPTNITSPLPTTSSPSQATATYRRRRKLSVTRPPPLGHPYLLMPPPSPSSSP